MAARESTWTNAGSEESALTIEDELRADGGKEDMLKTPNGTSEVFWVHDIFWRQAWGIRAADFKVRANSNARESVLTYEADDQQTIVLPPGGSFSMTRYVFPAKDLPDVLAVNDALASGVTSHNVRIQVRDAAGKPVADARVAIQAAAGSRGTAVTDADGYATVQLPSGEYSLNITWAGQSVTPPDALRIAVNGDAEMQFDLQQLHRGTVTASVTDAAGVAIPAKVEFRGQGDTPTPNWGPETAEYFVKNLAYTASGQFSTPLIAGDYDVIVSHGAEYDAVFTTLTVQQDKPTTLRASLKRSVDTTGWVSADYHSHSSPSGDNTGSQLGRVLNLAAEHIEFAPCTEHNRVSTYDGHIAKLGLQSYLATVSGMELTGQPLPLNHQNVFPMVYRPRTQDGGGPTTDGSPETQVERLALWDNRSRKLIQQNHPDIGWLFYDKDGNQQPDEGYARSFEHLDVMEIHPIDSVLDLQPFEMKDGKPFRNARIFNWLQLLNQGFRIYGVVNTDAHYNFHGSGGLRIWVQSSTDEPGEIDPQEMMIASEEGRIVMSNGPFLEASVRASEDGPVVVSGQDLNAEHGTVTARVRVQCPNWLSVDTVFVLINGEKHDDYTFTRDTHPGMFSDESVQFDESIEIKLDRDSHLVFVTGHRSERLGDVQGPAWGAQLPAALTNPIFVNVDGGEFEPSGGTLGSPLPVKK
jgi:hypothetical protein